MSQQAGDPLGNPITGLARPGVDIDPDFDPELSEDERVQRMSKRLWNEPGSSPRNLREQLAKIKEPGGARNLVHKNTGRDRLGIDDLSLILHPVFLAYGRWAHNLSDKTQIANRRRFRLWAKDRADREIPEGYSDTVTELTDSQVERLLDRHCPELWLPAKQRRSEGIRAPATEGRWVATAPYQVIQVDGTPVDLLTVDQYGKLVKALYRISAVDVFTGKTLAFAYTARLGSQAVRTLLWLLVSQQFVYPDTVPHGGQGAPHLPWEVHVLPGIQIQDLGSEYNNYAHLQTCTGIEMTVVPAPPGHGDKKPHVESGNRGVALFWQELPGATGANVTQRGWRVERGLVLRIDQVLALEAAYVDGVVHNTPRRRLRDPRYPGMTFTPNEFEDLYYRNGGLVGVDPDPYRALHFLTAQRRSFRSRGLKVDSKLYRPNDRDALKGMGYAEKEKLTVDVNEHVRTHIIIINKTTGLPVVIPDEALDDPVPPLADALDLDIRKSIIGGGAVGRRDPQELLQGLVEMAERMAMPIPKQKTTVKETPADGAQEPDDASLLQLIGQAMSDSA